MIKHTEVRIGNWINQLGWTQVDAGLLMDANDCDGVIYADPIPLTEDILKKCGFVESAGFRSAGFMVIRGIVGMDIQFYISLKSGKYGIEDISCETAYIYFNEMFLHQLQNLVFALTGKEIEYIP